jgi:hypothetical protein
VAKRGAKDADRKRQNEAVKAKKELRRLKEKEIAEKRSPKKVGGRVETQLNIREGLDDGKA